MRLWLAKLIAGRDMVVVPVIPTTAMREAGIQVIRDRGVNAFVQDDVYAAMVRR